MGLIDRSRLSWDAENALVRAHHAADGPIGPRHLFTGVAMEANSRSLLKECGVDLSSVVVGGLDLGHTGLVLPENVAFTDEGAEALRQAAAHDGPIRVWHLIAGLVRQGGVPELAGLTPESPKEAHDRIWARITDPNVVWGAQRLAEPRSKVVVPTEIRELTEHIGEVRRRKEEAVDAHDYGTAAAFRDVEKRLLAERTDHVREWAATLDVLALVEEVERLRAEVAELRDPN